jgi:large subunit ribosomal protein L10
MEKSKNINDARESHKVKENMVNKLSEKIKSSRTLMIVNIKSVPSRQFQDIKKTIREQAFIQVAKKNIMNRAIKKLGKESINGLEPYIKDNCAFATSELEGYELAAILLKNKTPIFAKAGQIAPADIEIKEGPTSLMPGPAISEFGALGIMIAVEEGKITVKKSKVVVSKGQEIKANIASLFQKLEIKPFKTGIEPAAIYDVESGKIYTDINVDSEKTTQILLTYAAKALGFAIMRGYISKETIGHLLAKANAHANALNKKVSSSSDNQLNKPEEA